MKLSVNILIFCLTIILGIPGGCGTEVGNPKKPGTSQVADDPEAASTIISSSVNEVASSVSEELAGSQIALAQEGFGLAEATLVPTRTCTEDNGQIIIKESNDTTNIDQITRKAGVVKRTTSEVASRTRTWKDAGEAVRCNSAKDGAKFAPKSMNTAKLLIDFSRKRTENADFYRTGAAVQPVQRKTVEVKGTREMDWKLLETGLQTKLEHTLKSDVAQSLSFVGAKGVTKELASRIFTDKDTPIKVQVVYESGAWVRRTIVSGKVVSSQTGDSSVQLSYNNVEYTKANGCAPVSGSISGAIFREGESSAAVTFEITFSSDIGTIKYSDGTEDEYVPAQCAMDG